MGSLKTSLRSSPLLPWILVGVLYLLIAGGKVLLTMGSPVFDWNDETGLYYTENALHYNYARAVARGESVPEWDRRIQYPEGLRVTEEFTVALEYASGYSYRFLSALGLNVPFHVYAVFFISFFSTLVVFPLFALTRGLCGSAWAAAAVVALYAFLPAGFLRTIAGFTREDFALPFLFTAITCLILALENERRWLPWLAGAAMAAGQHSWHLSPFVMTMLAVFVALVYFGHPRYRDRIADVYGITIACVVLGGLLSPVLRSKGFVISNSMILSYTLLATHFGGRRFGWSTAVRAGVFVTTGVVLVALVSLLSARNYQAYGHAFQLVFYKILYLGEKPADPNLLPPEARSLWMSSFANAKARQTWVYFSSLLVLGPVSIGLLIKDILAGKRRPALDLVLLFAAAFFVLYLIVSRLHVFAVFFLAATVGHLLLRVPVRRSVVAAVFGLIVTWEVHNANVLAIDLLRPPGGTDVDTVEWVKANTDPDDVILAAFSFSAEIFAYAGRQIVVHPKWDSHVVRDKVIHFKHKLFESEDAFYALCRQWDVDYFIYQASTVVDTTLESPRYEVGLTGIPRASAAYAFHFEPDRLKHFSLRYQNLYYRVYSVGDNRPPPADLVYNPIFDLTVVDPQGEGDTVALRGIGRLLAGMSDPVFHLRLGNALLQRERWRDAIAEFDRCLRFAPGAAEAHLGLARAHVGLGDLRTAARAVVRAVEITPAIAPGRLDDLPTALTLEVGRAFLAARRLDQGARWVEHAVDRDPRSAEARVERARIAMARNDAGTARQDLAAALEITPGFPPALKGLAVFHQAQGEDSLAAVSLRAYLAMHPADPDTASMRRYLQTIDPPSP